MVEIHFTAQANTRYLLECVVAGGEQVTTFTASDGVRQYATSSADKATLLYLRDQGAASEPLYVQIGGDKWGWYLDGCELTASAR